MVPCATASHQLTHIRSWWYMSRWNCTENETQHLRVICAHLSSAGVWSYIAKLFSTMKKLWADPTFNLLGSGAFELLLTDKQPLTEIVNQSSVTYTEIQPGVSFYENVMKTVALVKACSRTLRKELTVADHRMMFKLSCRHVSTEHILS